MFDVLVFSWKQHHTWFERAEVDRKFHAGLGVKAKFNGARIHHLADGMPLGKMAAEALVMTFWPGFKTRAAGKIGQIND